MAMMQTSNKCWTVSNWRFWRLQKMFRFWWAVEGRGGGGEGKEEEEGRGREDRKMLC